MSSSTSQEEPAQFTRSTIKSRDKRAPSSLTFPSTSSSANDKETIIDQYQEKMVDMLACQKELCTVKTHLSKVIDESKSNEIRLKQIILEKETKLEEASKRIQDLENENNSHMQNDVTQSSKAAKWKARCRQLQEIIDKQNKELQNKDETIKKQILEQKEIEKAARRQANELQKKLDYQVSQLSERKIELAELKQQSIISNESIINQQKQLDDVVRYKENLENQNSKLKEDKEMLKIQLKQSSDESVVHQATISDQLSSIQKLRKEKAKYKTECSDLKKAQINLKEQLERYTSLPKKIQELEQSLEKSKKLYEKETRKTNNATNILSIITSLVGEAYRPKDIISNVQKVCQERDNLKQKLMNLENSIKGVDDLSNELSRQKETIINLQKRLDANKQRNIIIKSIEKARKAANEQMTHYANSFGFDKEKINMRSLIITVLLGSRLSKMMKSIHSNYEYVTDNRNWWWMNSTEHEKMKSLLSESAGKLTAYQNQTEDLSKTNSELKEHIGKIEEEMMIKDKQIDENKKSLIFLRNEIHRLNDELSNLIDPETYSELQNNYVIIKKQLKEFRCHEQQLIQEKKLLSDQIEELTITNIDQSNEITVLQEEIEIAQAKIEKLTEDIRILEKSQMAKTKELLSLERGIMKVKASNDRNTAQCKALAIENQHLFNQMNPNKLCAGPDISCQASKFGLKATRTLL
ncbi:hypothetical protein TRFO_25094 [Tritrichomonas foetus]|uniref:Uncharacterized protein n=1 Tax=Tritrichomonas foetus TaxID=1144522 RepID=A0A1J4K6N5_9EUKA|nr:hypothetical protein TRFO_25094 [Tritrichomonas foetus]|eukprot:OHT06843.1 hypothetical protein TRFO_25094 [Tritrichomonas foetus]